MQKKDLDIKTRKGDEHQHKLYGELTKQELAERMNFLVIKRLVNKSIIEFNPLPNNLKDSTESRLLINLTNGLSKILLNHPAQAVQDGENKKNEIIVMDVTNVINEIIKKEKNETSNLQISKEDIISNLDAINMQISKEISEKFTLVHMADKTPFVYVQLHKDTLGKDEACLKCHININDLASKPQKIIEDFIAFLLEKSTSTFKLANPSVVKSRSATIKHKPLEQDTDLLANQKIIFGNLLPNKPSTAKDRFHNTDQFTVYFNKNDSIQEMLKWFDGVNEFLNNKIGRNIIQVGQKDTYYQDFISIRLAKDPVTGEYDKILAFKFYDIEIKKFFEKYKGEEARQELKGVPLSLFETVFENNSKKFNLLNKRMQMPDELSNVIQSQFQAQVKIYQAKNQRKSTDFKEDSNLMKRVKFFAQKNIQKKNQEDLLDELTPNKGIDLDKDKQDKDKQDKDTLLNNVIPNKSIDLDKDLLKSLEDELCKKLTNKNTSSKI